VRSFYLGNADAKQTQIMIKTMIRSSTVFIDEKLNLLIMRDTPEAVRMAERLIAAQDLAEPEVMLELEVLEVKRSKLQELGIQYPNQFTVLNIVPSPQTITTTGGVVVQSTDATTTTSQLTLNTLRGGPAAAQVGVSPNPTLNLRSESSDVNLLANPRIRVKNRDQEPRESEDPYRRQGAGHHHDIDGERRCLAIGQLPGHRLEARRRAERPAR
jgi:general secretion pathway protein D